MAELTHDQLQAIWDFEDEGPENGISVGDPGYPSGNNNADDVIIGTADDDVLGSSTPPAGNGDDEIFGLAGDDTLYGGNHHDALYGGSGNDTLYGGNQNDVLVGGAGDDDLWGGEGDDHFVFRFSVEQQSGGEQKTLYFRPNEDGTAGDMPDGNANPQAWLNYLQQLAAWREEMREIYGADLEDDMVDIELVNKNIDKFLAKYGDDLVAFDEADWAEVDLLAKTLSFDNSFTYLEGEGGAKSIMGEGNDTIHDWTISDNMNTLHFYGLSNSDGDVNHWDDWLSSEIVNGDTVILWDGGSITLKGYETTIEDLVDEGYVSFELPTAHYDLESVIA